MQSSLLINKNLMDKNKKNINDFERSFGAKVLSRDSKGRASKVRVDVLLKNENTKLFLVGPFNKWGRGDLTDYKFDYNKDGIASITTNKIKHKTKYKLLVKYENGKEMTLQDPAALHFDDMGNSVFWDFKDPDAYKIKTDFIDNFNRSVKIIQTDLGGLISHWSDDKGRCGRDIPKNEYYKFITESGVIKELKRLGFNTIQFLPFNQSIDGDNWKYRYLVPFHYAIQKNWGTPDEFAEMVDEFHKNGISVMSDFVIGHLPYKDFEIFGLKCDENGIHQWKTQDSNRLYMNDETRWGTMRVNYDDEDVRKFFVESAISMMKNYRIDGFRIDNVDGIIRHGPNGEGEERENGRTFLREVNGEIYDYNRFSMINFEAHYFKDDNAKLLIAPLDEDERALGATAYNSSRMTHFFHTKFMLEEAKKISVWKLKHILEEKEWGESNSVVADFHNHDAAAGLMENRCTGSYAYDAMTCNDSNNPGKHIHAVGKIKVMEALISFLNEGRTLDLVQTHLLQAGTFEHDSSIKWYLGFNQVNNNCLEFKKRVNDIMDDPAFWPKYVKNRKVLNVDDKNKILVVKRSANYEGDYSGYVIVINLSSWISYNYKVGLDNENDYELVLNSDLFDYSGFGMISLPGRFKNKGSNNFEVLEREIVIPKIAPYHVVVLKEINEEQNSRPQVDK